MKITLRIISLALVFVFIISLCGCFDPSKIIEKNSINKDAVDANYSPVEEININLPYVNGDSLNPYLAQSEANQNLTTLIYDSLYTVGNDFKAVGLIAESEQLNGNSLTVTIRSDVTFSDGSPLTVTDIVNSFNKAKYCDRYSDDLSNFDRVDATGNNSVTFMFRTFEVDLINLLTFPIIKTMGSESDDSASLSDEDTTFVVPLGSGRYFLTMNKNNMYYLCCNTKRLGGYFPKHRNIGLVATAEDENVSSMYSLGRINFVMDTYSSGEYTQIIGKAAPITLPNFVYLVCNTNKPLLHEPPIKKAISYAIDRKEICDFCFIGNGVPTELPFHPDYYKTAKSFPLEDKTNADAIALLESEGYTQINRVYNFRYNEEDTSKVLEFSLAVCRNSQFKRIAAKKIKEQLAKVNIRVNIYEYNEDDFFKVLSTSSYDMYIGECMLKNNLNFSRFFVAGASLSYGINAYSDSAVAYNAYQAGTSDIGLFANTFKDDLPFIPLLYRTGSVFSNQAMNTPDKSSVTDYFSNADQWTNVND
ncbi:MAG: ABC transporter substrate-binding protein [Clostridia bacterium]|nr:ABC transporter substrate-binding protein [Clostridia bacterium]